MKFKKSVFLFVYFIFIFLSSVDLYSLSLNLQAESNNREKYKIKIVVVSLENEEWKSILSSIEQELTENNYEYQIIIKNDINLKSLISGEYSLLLTTFNTFKQSNKNEIKKVILINEFHLFYPLQICTTNFANINTFEELDDKPLALPLNYNYRHVAEEILRLGSDYDIWKLAKLWKWAKRWHHLSISEALNRLKEYEGKGKEEEVAAIFLVDIFPSEEVKTYRLAHKGLRFKLISIDEKILNILSEKYKTVLIPKSRYNEYNGFKDPIDILTIGIIKEKFVEHPFIFIQEGENKKFEDIIRRAVANYYKKMGDILAFKKETQEEATEYYISADLILPNNKEILEELANTYNKRGLLELAREEYNKLNELYPTNYKYAKAHIDLLKEIRGKTPDVVPTELRFSAMASFKDDSLMAKNYFEVEKPPSYQRIFRFYLDFPIKKYKTNFFIGYDNINLHDFTTVYTGQAFQNFNETIPQPLKSNRGMVRIWHLINKNQRLTFHLYYEDKKIENDLAGGIITKSNSRMTTNNIYSSIFNHDYISENIYNHFKFRFFREDSSYQPFGLYAGPELKFPSAIIGQNSATPQNIIKDHYSFENHISYFLSTWKGYHEFKINLEFERTNINSLLEDFSGGLFLFTQDDLNSIPYNRILGVGKQSLDRFSINKYSLSIEDDCQINDKFSFNLGLRYDLEILSNDHSFKNVLYEKELPLNLTREINIDRNNFAPRISFTYDLFGNGMSTIGAAYGIFYKSALVDLLLNESIYNNISYSILTVFKANDISIIPRDIFIISPDMVFPYTHYFSINLSQNIFSDLLHDISANISYRHEWGLKDLRNRPINPLNAATGKRFFPNLGDIKLIESSGRSKLNSLSIGLKTNMFPQKYQFSLSYTLAKIENFVDNFLDIPANPFDLDDEWGPSINDIRHSFNLFIAYILPYDISLGANLILTSGKPYNIITGVDNNNDGYLTDRPDGMGRNSARAPGYSCLNLMFSKNLNIKNNYNIDLIINVFNLFNHVNYDPISIIGNKKSSIFGQPTMAFEPLNIQFSIRFNFGKQPLTVIQLEPLIFSDIF